MKKLKTQLRKELKKEKPNVHLIKKLRHFIEKKTMTLTEFRDTGVFTTEENFRYYNPKAKLHSDTTQVVMYIGGYYIEVRKPNTYFTDGFSSNVLDDAENELWEKKVAKDLHIN